MPVRRRLAALPAALLSVLAVAGPPVHAGDGESLEALELGGALRFQYAYRDWEPDSRNRGGDLEFDVFRLNLAGTQGRLEFAVEYRWYSFMDVLHHGWVGYELSPAWQLQLGAHQVPFGILPYASNSFFFSSNFYLGLEDDYDAGLKALYRRGPWDVALAFYKNAELGDASNSERYSYDVLVGGEQQNEEVNQVNLRAAYLMERGDASAELGASLQYGGLYNRATEETGDRAAAALHLSGSYQRWNLQLQATRYEYSPRNPPGVDDSVVQVGAYGFFDLIPAEATSLVANLAYALPVEWGPVDSITFYNDHSSVFDKSGGFRSTRMNVTGMAIAAGNLYTFVDLVVARNQPFVGGSIAGRDDSWNTRFNVNLGYYF